MWISLRNKCLGEHCQGHWVALAACGLHFAALRSSEGHKAELTGCASTCCSTWPSATSREAVSSLRRLSIEASKSDDATSESGSPGVGPGSEQSIAEKADSLSASTAAPSEVVKSYPLLLAREVSHPKARRCSHLVGAYHTVSLPPHAQVLQLEAMCPAGAQGEASPASPCRHGQHAPA